MFDLLRPVPAQQVQHGGVGTDLVQLLGVQDPLAQDRGVVLDPGDEGQSGAQPGELAGTGQVTVAQDHAEQPGDLFDVGARVETVGVHVVEHARVGLGVYGLLSDEAEHLLP